MTLPPRRSYAVGIAFLPDDDEGERAAMTTVESIAAEEGLDVLGWRDVPIDPSGVGEHGTQRDAALRAALRRRRLAST